MSIGIKESLQQSIIVSQKAKDSKTLGVLRLISSTIKQFEIDKQTVAENQDCLEILVKMLKQRKDSIKYFQEASRNELVAQEEFEIQIIQKFMPNPLDSEELLLIVKKGITKVGANSPKDISKVLTAIESEVFARADTATISKLIKNNL